MDDDRLAELLRLLPEPPSRIVDAVKALPDVLDDVPDDDFDATPDHHGSPSPDPAEWHDDPGLGGDDLGDFPDPPDHDDFSH